VGLFRTAAACINVPTTVQHFIAIEHLMRTCNALHRELDGCYLAKNFATGREGRVSTESVHMITSDDMTSQT